MECMPFKLAFIAGARPNFMKIAPLMEAFSNRPEWEPALIHTGQHYDDSMSGSFSATWNPRSAL